MKKITLFILLSTLAFSTDVELYTSSVIKLIQENKRINIQLRNIRRKLLVSEHTDDNSKKNYIQEKTEKEKEEILSINNFISDNS